MDEIELRLYILKNPNSELSQAYRLGRKDMNIELQKSINKLEYLKK